MNNNCNQAHSLNDSAGRANTNAGLACLNAYRSCDQVCRDAGNTSTAQSCLGLSSLADDLFQQSSTNWSASADAINCEDNTAASPSSNGSNKGDSSASRDLAAASTTPSEACATDPKGPGCTQATAAEKISQQNADAMAKLSDSNTAQANYDVGDISGTKNGVDLGQAAQNGGGGAGGTTVKPITNNSGGGLPGGVGGQGKSGGILGGNGGGGLFGGNASGVTDIDKGLRSGGFSTTPSTEEEKPDASGGFSGYGRDLASVPTGTGGLDLKQYLPGGRLAADTLRAAAMQWQSLGIHPSHIDLWTRISEKMQQKCKLGELIDCN